MTQKKEFIILVLFILFSIGLIIVFKSCNTQTDNLYVSVKYKDDEICILPLSSDFQKKIENDEGYNIIVVKKNTVFVKEADCPNQICVHTKSINHIGEMIICLPHHLILEIVEN